MTGLVVNRKVNVSREYTRRLRALLYIWKQYGEDDAREAFWRRNPHPNWPPDKPGPDFRSIVRGRVQHVGSIKGWTDPVYLSLAASLNKLDSSFTLPDPPRSPQSVYLLVEGKTDISHMLAAQRYFHERGEFKEVELTTDSHSDCRGDSRLLQRCEHLATTKQLKPCVGLIDRDDSGMVKKAVGDNDWKHWGNGVVAVALTSTAGQPVCIELLHEREVLERTDQRGRRVFLKSEFNERTGLHEAGPYVTPNPKSGALIPGEVYDKNSGESVALSKQDFSKAIYDRAEPFQDVIFEGFRDTFRIIVEAVHEAAKHTA